MDGEAGNKFNQWVRRAILEDESRNRKVGKLKDTGARQNKGAPGPLFVLGVERFTEGRADRNTSACNLVPGTHVNAMILYARLQISREKPLWLGSRCARSLAADSETLAVHKHP